MFGKPDTRPEDMATAQQLFCLAFGIDYESVSSGLFTKSGCPWEQVFQASVQTLVAMQPQGTENNGKDTFNNYWFRQVYSV